MLHSASQAAQRAAWQGTYYYSYYYYYEALMVKLKQEQHLPSAHELRSDTAINLSPFNEHTVRTISAKSNTLSHMHFQQRMPTVINHLLSYTHPLPAANTHNDDDPPTVDDMGQQAVQTVGTLQVSCVWV